MLCGRGHRRGRGVLCRRPYPGVTPMLGGGVAPSTPLYEDFHVRPDAPVFGILYRKSNRTGESVGWRAAVQHLRRKLKKKG